MKLITSDSYLRKFTPNTMTTVAGETPLYDKLAPFLEIAEEWVKTTFTSDDIFDTICGYTDANIVKIAASKVVVSHAFIDAVPSLDVVLTPNGFGIVSNSNIAPASKERVERLIASLEAVRDRSIRLLMQHLPDTDGWNLSSQYGYFSATLFPNLDICDSLGYAEHQWQKYLELRAVVMDIEQWITVQYIGKEQMDAFRKEVISPSSTSPIVKTVIGSLRAEIVQRVKARVSHTVQSARLLNPPTALDDIVNIIMNNENDFPLWHESAIKELFSPPIYENRKKDCGYWF